MTSDAPSFDGEWNAAVERALATVRSPLEQQRLTRVICVQRGSDHALLARDVDRVGVANGRRGVDEARVDRACQAANRFSIASGRFIGLSHHVIFAEPGVIGLAFRARHVRRINALRHI